VIARDARSRYAAIVDGFERCVPIDERRVRIYQAMICRIAALGSDHGDTPLRPTPTHIVGVTRQGPPHPEGMMSGGSC
jgi:hypothetical protein